MCIRDRYNVLPQIPRAVNRYGYPIEGIKTRYVEVDGTGYLYALNVRKEPTACHLVGPRQNGRDLIGGRDVGFPRVLNPLEPLLVRLDGTVREEPKPSKARDILGKVVNFLADPL